MAINMNRRQRRQQKFQHVQKEPQATQGQPRITYYGPKTIGQRNLKLALENNRFVVINGPAGSGKTLMSVQQAIELLLSKKVERIILSRPAVPADENIGTLPGGIREKLDPYLRALYDAINDIVGDTTIIDRWMRETKLEIAPLGYLRGRTFKRAAIVFDEAQNATYQQIKMVATRLGEGSYMFFTGDNQQSDIGTSSGYPKFIERLSTTRYPVVTLGSRDVIRDPIVQELVEVL